MGPFGRLVAASVSVARLLAVGSDPNHYRLKVFCQESAATGLNLRHRRFHMEAHRRSFHDERHLDDFYRERCVAMTSVDLEGSVGINTQWGGAHQKREHPATYCSAVS